MSLSGSELLCLGENGEVEKIFEPKEKTFRIGYYTSCDFIHEHPEAKGIHCEIVCDAFGRISVKNLSLENPISVNGSVVKGSRPLLSGNIIEILGKKFCWKYGASKNNIKTPENKAPKSEQPPTSDPSVKEHKLIQKRLTVHSFAYGLRSQLEESVNGEMKTKNTNSDLKEEIENKEENRNIEVLVSVISPQQNMSNSKDLENTLSFSKTFKNDKENETPKAILSLCRQSQVVLTSYSPSTPGSKSSKSFACVTPAKTTPRSLYSTPKGILSDHNAIVDVSEEIIDFKTPNTTRFGNNSMHLIDLTTFKTNTPIQHKSSPLLKSGLKKSVKCLTKSSTKQTKLCSLNESNLKQGKSIRNPPGRSVKRSLSLTPNQKFEKILKTPQDNKSLNKLSAALAQDTTYDNIASTTEFAHITLDSSTSSTINVDSTDMSDGSVIEISTDDLSSTPSLARTRRGTPVKNTSLVRKVLISSARKIQARNVEERSVINHNNSKVNKGSAVRNLKFGMIGENPSDKKQSAGLNSSATSNEGQGSKTVRKSSFASKSLIVEKSSLKRLTPKPNTSLGLPNVLTTSTPLRGRKSMATTIQSTPLKSATKQGLTGNYRRHSCINSNPTTPVRAKTPKKCFTHVEKKTSRQMKENVKSGNDEIQQEDTLGVVEDTLNSTFTMDTEDNPTGEEFNLIKEEVIENKEKGEKIEQEQEPDYSAQESSGVINNSPAKESPATTGRRQTRKSKSLTKFESYNQYPIVISEEDHGSIKGMEYNKDISEVQNFTLSPVINTNIINSEEKDEKKIKNASLKNKLETSQSDDYCFRPIGMKPFNTPNPEQDDNLVGIKELVKTPKSLKNIIESFTGIKESVKSGNDEIQQEDTLGVVEETLNSTFTMDTEGNPTGEEFNLIKEEVIENKENGEKIEQEQEPDYSTQESSGVINNSPAKESPATTGRRQTRKSKSLTKFENYNQYPIVISEEDHGSIKGMEYNKDISEVQNFTLSPVINTNIINSEEKDEKKIKNASLKNKLETSQSDDYCFRPIGMKPFNTPNPEQDDNLVGIKELVKTPKSLKNSIEDFTGIKELVKTPKESHKCKENLVGIKELLKTPKSSGKLEENLVGLRELVKTPKIHKNYDDFLGVRDMLQTPKDNRLENVGDEMKELMKTPIIFSSRVNDNLHLSNTPKPSNLNKERDVDEVAFKTPSAKMLMVLGTPQSINVNTEGNSAEILGPIVCDFRENMEEMEDLFQTPGVPKIIKQVEEKDSGDEHLSAEQSFDKFVGRPVIKRSYARKSVSPKNQIICIQTEKNKNELPKTDIQEWVEKVSLRSSSKYFNGEEINNRIIETEISDALEEEEMVSIHNCSDTGNVSGIHVLDSTRDSMFSGHLAYSDDEMSDFDNFLSIPNLRSTRSKSYTPQRPSDAQLKRRSTKELRKTLSGKPPNVSFDVEAGKANQEEENHDDPIRENQTIAEKSPPKLISPKNLRENDDKDEELSNFADKPSLRSCRNRSTNDTPNKTLTTQIRKTLTNEANDKLVNVEIGEERVAGEKEFENFSEKISSSSITRKSVIDVESKCSNPTTRKTGGSKPLESSFNLEIEKEKHEIEVAFQNFDNISNTRGVRGKSVNEIQPKNLQKPLRKTLGNNKPNVSFDIKAEKERLEIEEAFKNFNENPNTRSTRGRSLMNETAYEDISMSPGRTLGNETCYLSFNLEVEREKLEMEKAFEHFQAEPKLRGNRGKSVEGNTVKMVPMKPRKTMGNVSQEISFNVEIEKERLELEEVFKNFDEKPTNKSKRGKSAGESIINKTNKFTKSRKTMGNTPQTTSVDFEIEKERVELEKVFENFEGEPAIRSTRGKSIGDTASKSTFQNSRKTMGTALVDVSFDIEAEKERVEMEKAFQNLEEKPTTTRARGKSLNETVSKISLNKIRKTMGTTPEDKFFDIQTEKERVEMEKVFKNFQEKPAITCTRRRSVGEAALKNRSGSSRKTIGNAMQDLEISFDIETEKERIEMEKVFENFVERPRPSITSQMSRSFGAYSPKKTSAKTRKTMWAEQKNVSFNIEIEKERIEVEKAFENFKEKTTYRGPRCRSVNESALKETLPKPRKTMGVEPQVVSFDIEIEKERIEIEKALENLENRPATRGKKGRSVSEFTSKKTSKEPRKTVAYVPQDQNVSFDIETEKERVEVENAFQNFKDKPSTQFTRGRSVGESVPKTKSMKPRKTMWVDSLKVSFDIESEKERVELEKAFENFGEKSMISGSRSRSVQSTPRKTSMKLRKTMGCVTHDKNLSFDIETEKERVEVEMAFQHFEENPNTKFTRGRSVGEPAPKTTSTKVRKTMGIELEDISFDIEMEKERIEMEKVFENFEDQPTNRSTKAGRSVGEFVPQTVSAKPRMTMGNVHQESSFDIGVEKKRIEMENDFQNFEEHPIITVARGRSVNQSTQMTNSLLKHRNTLGNEPDHVLFDVKLEKGRVEYTKLKKSENAVEDAKSDIESSHHNADASEDYDSTYSFMELNVKSSKEQESICVTPTLEKDEEKVSVDGMKDIMYEKSVEIAKSLPSKHISQIEIIQEEVYEVETVNFEVSVPIKKEERTRLRRKGSKIQEIFEDTSVTPIENKVETESLKNNSNKTSIMINIEEKSSDINPVDKTSRTSNKIKKEKDHSGNVPNETIQKQQEIESEEEISKSFITKTDTKEEDTFSKETKEKSFKKKVAPVNIKPILRRGGRLRNKNETNTISTVEKIEQEAVRLEEEKTSSPKMTVPTGRPKRVRRKADRENSFESQLNDPGMEKGRQMSSSNSRKRRDVTTFTEDEKSENAATKDQKAIQECSEKVKVSAKQRETSLEMARKETNSADTLETAMPQNPRKVKKVTFKLQQRASETDDDSPRNVEVTKEVVTESPSKNENLLLEVNKTSEAIVKRRGGRRKKAEIIKEQTVEEPIHSKNTKTPITDPSAVFIGGHKKEDDTSTSEIKESSRIKQVQVDSTSEVEMVPKTKKSLDILETKDAPASKVNRRGRIKKIDVKETTSVSQNQTIKEAPENASEIGAATEKNSNCSETEHRTTNTSESKNKIETVRSRRGRRKKNEDNDERISSYSGCNVTENEEEVIQTKRNPEVTKQNEEPSKNHSEISESKEVDSRKPRRGRKPTKVQVKQDLEENYEAKNAEIESQNLKENKDFVVIPEKRGRRKVEVKEEVIVSSPATRSQRGRRGNQEKLTVLQNTSQTKSENFEIKEEIVIKEIKKSPKFIRKRGRKNSTEKPEESSNISETSEQKKDTLLLSETESEEIPRKKRAVGRKNSNKENVSFEDVPAQKMYEQKNKSDNVIPLLRSRTRRQADNLLEISEDEITPIKPTSKILTEKEQILTPTTEGSTTVEFKTPVNVVPRVRRCLRSNSTHTSTPKFNEAQEQLSGQDLSKSEINVSVGNKDKSENKIPAVRRGRLRLNSTKEDVPNVETDEEQPKSKKEVGTSRARAGRRKKEVESDVVDGEENLQKRSRRNADQADKNSTSFHILDSDEENSNKKTNESEAEKSNKKTINTSKQSAENKQNQQAQAEASTEKVLPTRSTRGKRKSVEANMSTETEEAPTKRTTRSRRK